MGGVKIADDRLESENMGDQQNGLAYDYGMNISIHR